MYWHETFVEALSKAFGGQKETMSGDETTWDMIMDVLAQPSFFGPRLWVIRDAGGLLANDAKHTFRPEFISSGNCLTMLCFSKENPASKQFMSGWAQAGCAVLTAPEPSFGETSQWVSSEFSKHGLKITRDAVGSLILIVGRSMERLEKEIEKVRLYMKSQEPSGGKDGAKLVTDRVIAVCASQDPEKNTFGLVDAVAAKDLAGALSEYWDLKSRGANPIMLISIVASHFGLMWRAKEASAKGIDQNSLGKVLGVHPYPAKKALQQSARWNFQQLESALRLLCDVDESIKTGKTDLDKGFEYALATLSRL